MDEQEFNKYKETIENFIIEELILRVPGLINFTIHRLPEILVKDTEYIFFIFEIMGCPGFVLMRTAERAVNASST